jgi:23S rRNA pseudouridine1911/1915/1917 synthase
MDVTVPASLAGERLDRAIALITGMSRAAIAELVSGGGVRIGGEAVTTRSRRLAEGDAVSVDVPDVAAAAVCSPDPTVDVPLVHVDDAVLVVDKPAGMVVHPGAGHGMGTLVQGLLARFPELAGVGDPARPGIVHRLDAGTSGLLVVARTPVAFAALTAQIASRSAARRYLALVLGHPEAEAGVVDAPVGRSARDRTRMAITTDGKSARTGFEVQATYHEPVACSLVRCTLETGRTHQIRVHLAAIGHPVAGDARYGGTSRILGLTRPFLHAAELAFDHPTTAARATFQSPLPPDLEDVRVQLR